MKEAMLIIAGIIVFAIGFFVMGRIDKFIVENKKRKKTSDSDKRKITFYDDDEQSISTQIDIIKENHEDVEVAVFVKDEEQ